MFSISEKSNLQPQISQYLDQCIINLEVFKHAHLLSHGFLSTTFELVPFLLCVSKGQLCISKFRQSFVQLSVTVT